MNSSFLIVVEYCLPIWVSKLKGTISLGAEFMTLLSEDLSISCKVSCISSMTDSDFIIF